MASIFLNGMMKGENHNGYYLRMRSLWCGHGYGSELNMHLCDRCYNGIAAYLENKYAVVSCECDKQTSNALNELNVYADKAIYNESGTDEESFYNPATGTYETKVKRWVKKTPGGYVYE